MNSIEPFHPGIRIGDFVGVMIFANYLKVIEKVEHLTFNIATISKFVDPSLNVEVLFKDVIDDFTMREDEWADVDGCTKRGVGCVWVTAPAVYAKYGSQIIPKLNLDSHHYTGPDLDWGEYICFSPLFDGSYNPSRTMSNKLCNDLINDLDTKYGNRLIVITDQPNLVHNKKINCYVDSNLYNLIYIISKSRMYIGGDTGFTHFAALGRPRGIVSIYEDDPLIRFNLMRDNVNYPLVPWNSEPMHDQMASARLHLTMVNNELSNFDMIMKFITVIDIDQK